MPLTAVPSPRCAPSAMQNTVYTTRNDPEDKAQLVDDVSPRPTAEGSPPCQRPWCLRRGTPHPRCRTRGRSRGRANNLSTPSPKSRLAAIYLQGHRNQIERAGRDVTRTKNLSQEATASRMRALSQVPRPPSSPMPSTAPQQSSPHKVSTQQRAQGDSFVPDVGEGCDEFEQNCNRAG